MWGHWLYLEEGDEVGPWGELLEYTDWRVDRPGPRVSRRPPQVKYRRRDQYPEIFFSYRRDDAGAYADRLHEALVRTFGAPHVFFDQFSIRTGEDFAWTIQQAVWHASVMVLLVGHKWTAPDENGRRRIDDERDYVRREVVAALDTATTIVPVVLPGGPLLGTTNLPYPDMWPLVNVQALEISPRHWDADTQMIMDAIRAALEQAGIDLPRDDGSHPNSSA